MSPGRGKQMYLTASPEERKVKKPLQKEMPDEENTMFGRAAVPGKEEKRSSSDRSGNGKSPESDEG